MDSFQYEPLQPNGNQVRLLCFSDDPGGQPGYTLKTFKLNESPPYDALSYTWGPPLPTKIICLNKRSFEVRENLWDFLDHIGRTGITVLDKDNCYLLPPTYLWIDQICIDQSSKGEKSHQVGRMSEIYKQSQRVIVWLGCDDQHSDTAMRLMADIRLVQRPIYKKDSSDFPADYWTAMSKDYQNNLPRLLNDRHSVENLLRRRYWGRLWIVQEFVLAQALLLVCGSYAIPSTALTNLIYVSEIPRWFGKSSVITIPKSVHRLFTARNERETGVTFSLPEIQMIDLFA